MTMKKIDDFNNVTLILYIELNQIQKLIIIVYLRLIDTSRYQIKKIEVLKRFEILQVYNKGNNSL